MNWMLEKLYFDLQTPDGTAFIGYRAELKAGCICMPYAASLLKKSGQNPLIRQSLLRGRITAENDETRWQHKHLGLTGRWRPGNEGLPYFRADYSQGFIDWKVLGAGVSAQVRFQDGSVISGSGYWEKMLMTLPPWCLPFPELKWGRFLADDGENYLVWVAWLGGNDELCRLWSRTGELAGLDFKPDGLSFSDGILTFSGNEILRAGPLFKSLCGPLNGLAAIFPNGLGQAREDKYFSRALWTRPNGEPLPGWAIHETVFWR